MSEERDLFMDGQSPPKSPGNDPPENDENHENDEGTVSDSYEIPPNKCTKHKRNESDSSDSENDHVAQKMKMNPENFLENTQTDPLLLLCSVATQNSGDINVNQSSGINNNEFQAQNNNATPCIMASTESSESQQTVPTHDGMELETPNNDPFAKLPILPPSIPLSNGNSYMPGDRNSFKVCLTTMDKSKIFNNPFKTKQILDKWDMHPLIVDGEIHSRGKGTCCMVELYDCQESRDLLRMPSFKLGPTRVSARKLDDKEADINYIKIGPLDDSMPLHEIYEEMSITNNSTIESLDWIQPRGSAFRSYGKFLKVKILGPPPTHVRISNTSYPTHTYNVPMLRCTDCLEIGHSFMTCSQQIRCSRCSGHHYYKTESTVTDGNPTFKVCEKAEHCFQCKGQHSPTSNSCPKNALATAIHYDLLLKKIKLRDINKKLREIRPKDWKKHNITQGNSINSSNIGSQVHSTFVSPLTTSNHFNHLPQWNTDEEVEISEEEEMELEPQEESQESVAQLQQAKNPKRTAYSAVLKKSKSSKDGNAGKSHFPKKTQAPNTSSKQPKETKTQAPHTSSKQLKELEKLEPNLYQGLLKMKNPSPQEPPTTKQPTPLPQKSKTQPQKPINRTKASEEPQTQDLNQRTTSILMETLSLSLQGAGIKQIILMLIQKFLDLLLIDLTN